MKPAPFTYHAPSGVDEALSLLSEYGDEAKALAGGQSLMPLLAMRLARFGHLIDLGNLPELRGTSAEDGVIRIGSMTLQADIERDAILREEAPLVAEATRLIGHYQIRNRGTIGGSVAHADPAAEYPATLMALDARAVVQSGRGTRRVPFGDLFLGTWSTAIAPDELLTSVEIGRAAERSGAAIEEVARRRGDFALVGAVCRVELDPDGGVRRTAICLMGMESTPVRLPTVEATIVGQNVTDVDPEEIGRAAVAGLHPPHDMHGTADYRSVVCARLVAKALTRAVQNAGE